MRLLKPSTVDIATPDTDATPVPRDRYDRPLVRVPGAAKPVPYTRCTTFVDCIEDKTSLTAWGKRMVVVGATHAPHLITRARGLDPQSQQDKQALNRLADQLVQLAGANDKREKGTRLHALSEYVDRGDPLPPCTHAELDDMIAYKTATVALDVVHIERLVVLDDLKVAGTPDRISHYDGPGPDGRPLTANLITDLKTGSVDYGALKMAMQLAVYSRGQHYDHITGGRIPLPDVNQDWGLIIHLPAGAAQCTVYWIDLAAGWEAAGVAAQVRALRSRRKLMIALPAQASQITSDTVADLPHHV